MSISLFSNPLLYSVNERKALKLKAKIVIYLLYTNQYLWDSRKEYKEIKRIKGIALVMRKRNITDCQLKVMVNAYEADKELREARGLPNSEALYRADIEKRRIS